jgi:iron complex outermembrane receptor protein
MRSTTRGVGCWLLRSVLALAVAASIAVTGRAHDTELDQVIVTGTRIPRPDFDSPSPIVSVTQDLFQHSVSSSAETALNTLPQFVPAYGSSSNNPSNGGQGNVQLRGLGSASTLVLIDGKRLIPANGTGVVDVNVIPVSLIESVEIITGGASAVYGSDAIAGVVNFRLREAHDGVELDAQWGQTDRGDGAERGGGVTAGLDWADGHGVAFGYIGYTERDPVLSAQRDFARYALGYVGPGAGGIGPDGAFLPFGSAVIEEGIAYPLEPSQAAFENLFAAYGYANRHIEDHLFGFGSNTDGTVFAQGNFEPGSVLNFRDARDPVFFNDLFYTYNFAPSNYLRLPLERASAFARAKFELSESAEIYAQGLYADYTVDLQLAPTPADELWIPRSNPYISHDLALLLDSRADPTENLTFHKRLTELGPRLSHFQYDVYQATVGLRGRLRGGWSYDVYVQQGSNDQVETQTGNALRSRIEQLTFAPDGGVSLCGGFDPFGRNSISAECAAYIAVGGTNRAHVDQAIVEGSLTGSMLQLPAGELRTAFGVFYKRDEYVYEGDPIAAVFIEGDRPDIAGFTASDDIDGSDSNLDLYVEASVPLLPATAGIGSLELVAGYRHSDYESAGRADSYKAELLYQPLESWGVRGSYQRAVRAPSVYELYLPQLPSTFFAGAFALQIDPCEAGSPERSGPDRVEVEKLCLAQGVPADVLRNYVDPSHDADGFVGGNPDLAPEAADTVTAGVVFSSPSDHPLLRHLQVSLDWYRINVDGAIATVYAHQFIGRCFDRTFNPGFDRANRWCSMFSRDPEVGDIVDAYEILRNTSGVRTSGVDLHLAWTLELARGELGLDWLVSHVDQFARLEADGVPPTELVGTTGSDFIGTSFPEWKWNLGLSYTLGSLSLDARWRYVAAMTDAQAPELEVPQYDCFDLGAAYNFEQGWLVHLSVRIGLENVTDAEPPLMASNSGGNTDPSQYDVLGRRYYVRLNYRF